MAAVRHQSVGPWQEGLSVEDSSYIFVTSRTGFEQAFQKHHQALQFKGYLGTSCIAWCQEEVLWPANYSHTRLDLDCGYGLAAFLLTILGHWRVRCYVVAPSRLISCALWTSMRP